MSNEVAPKGKLFICTACGKRSMDKYGEKEIDYGWDISCVLNSMLVDESLLIIGEDGTVTGLREKLQSW